MSIEEIEDKMCLLKNQISSCEEQLRILPKELHEQELLQKQLLLQQEKDLKYRTLERVIGSSCETTALLREFEEVNQDGDYVYDRLLIKQFYRYYDRKKLCYRYIVERGKGNYPRTAGMMTITDFKNQEYSAHRLHQYAHQEIARYLQMNEAFEAPQEVEFEKPFILRGRTRQPGEVHSYYIIGVELDYIHSDMVFASGTEIITYA